MATGRYKKKNRGADDVNFRGSFHTNLVPMGNDSNKDEPHIPWALLIALLVMCLVLIVALPVMGIMYMDMNNATNAAIQEIKKMRELRAKILIELRGE